MGLCMELSDVVCPGQFNPSLTCNSPAPRYTPDILSTAVIFVIKIHAHGFLSQVIAFSHSFWLVLFQVHSAFTTVSLLSGLTNFRCGQLVFTQVVHYS